MQSDAKIVPAPIVAVEAVPVALDPAKVAPADLAVAATLVESDRAELAAFRAERAARETAERRELVTALVVLEAETPATAWTNGAPVSRLAAEPIDALRGRVDALRAIKSAAAGAVQPPLAASMSEDALTDFERRDAAKIADPDARARFVSKRLARKQKVQ